MGGIILDCEWDPTVLVSFCSELIVMPLHGLGHIADRQEVVYPCDSFINPIAPNPAA